MIDARAFLDTVSEYVAGRSTERPHRLAVIDPAYAAGAPKVTFEGESTMTTKTYKRVSSYTPVANDRVLLAPVGNTYVILGKVV